MAEGEVLLVAGCRLLVACPERSRRAGCWLQVTGSWLLAAGCWLLVAGILFLSTISAERKRKDDQNHQK
ncbi:MAG: hypothetical protein DRJ15_16645, partial [Bacteroidetes bacterium]